MYFHRIVRSISLPRPFRFVIQITVVLCWLPGLFGTVSGAYAAEVTLALSHFLSPKSATHSAFLEPWARRVEEQSNQRIKIEIFPSMSLGGTPAQLYRQLRDGVADMVWTLTGYTPGVFPRSEVFELPSVHKGSATATNLAIQKVFPMIKDDFKDIVPLLVHVHAGQAIHLVNGCVSRYEDLAGLKLRTPSRTGAWIIEAWNAEPVGMSVPALPEALSKGTVDGALIPFEIVPALKVHELTKCSVISENEGRFGTAVFLFGMNKDSYQSLPPDLRAVIDANAMASIAEGVGNIWDDFERLGMDVQKSTGSRIIALDAHPNTAMVVGRWVQEANDAGFDGAAYVVKARAAVDKFSK